MLHLKSIVLRILPTLLLLIVLLAPAPVLQIISAADRHYPEVLTDDNFSRDHVETNRRADPCENEPPGNAPGRDLHCPPQGSSSGIARGDFNGDGIGDLAIGVPFEDIADAKGGTIQDAGGVNIIYGSAAGLNADAGPSDQFFGYARTNGRAGSALAAGDFDGDGFSDLAIGAPFDDAPKSPFEDGSVRQVPFVNSSIRDGSSNTIDVKESIVPVQQQMVQSAGRVHIFYGSPAGLVPNSWQSLTLGHIPNNVPHTLDEFGAALAWGDFDGNGIGDLAVGIPGYNLQAGAVGIFYGSSNRFYQNRQLWTQNSSGIADNAEAGDRFGAALAGGEFGISTNASDLAIGVPGEDVNVTTFSGRIQVTTTIRDAGAVHIFYGDSAVTPGGLTANNSQIWTQNSRQIEGSGEIADICEEDDRFGSALASFGFGSSDLAIGVPGEDVGTISDAGAVNVIYFNPGANMLSFLNNQFWTQDSTNIEDEAETGDQFGSALAGGDFNGDNLKDLAIGVPGETLNDQTTPISNAGAVNVIYYQAFGVGLSANAGPGDQFWTQDSPGILNTAAAGERFGSALTAWDFGNGFLVDLAVGVPFQTVKFAGAGSVNVIYGDNTTFIPGLGAANNQFWNQDSPNIEGVSESGDQFGRTIY